MVPSTNSHFWSMEEMLTLCFPSRVVRAPVLTALKARCSAFAKEWIPGVASVLEQRELKNSLMDVKRDLDLMRSVMVGVLENPNMSAKIDQLFSLLVGKVEGQAINVRMEIRAALDQLFEISNIFDIDAHLKFDETLPNTTPFRSQARGLADGATRDAVMAANPNALLAIRRKLSDRSDFNRYLRSTLVHELSHLTREPTVDLVVWGNERAYRRYAIDSADWLSDGRVDISALVFKGIQYAAGVERRNPLTNAETLALLSDLLFEVASDPNVLDEYLARLPEFTEAVMNEVRSYQGRCKSELEGRIKATEREIQRIQPPAGEAPSEEVAALLQEHQASIDEDRADLANFSIQVVLKNGLPRSKLPSFVVRLRSPVLMDPH
ncbi:hypothetical protein D7S86_16075 [Pararobbsia silviterrae]|uniref:Uncharacterized protein n=1 Tax=Pararobbsia silviterrae TaxID=1792498 RepID=A0A494Y097_9BURK|nr:hypothetical protein D7S86_16075 [Pararobbsia silviterrae]